ncbi:properdin [Pseudonaja textilis]|uniref:properdin n=1 Tax=Pseudonaja textilis TaxID=8673 RepID=UPI000EA85F6C|nr:properdin [Pseudonaja textilis]
METPEWKSLQFLVIVCWFFVSLESLAEAVNVLCYKTFDEISGTCSNLLGDGVSQEDCCLNDQYGFQLTENGACQSCRGAQWSKWSSWSACSVSCTEGVQRRSRVCYGYHEGTCPIGTRDREMKSCLLKECCPVMGGWSEWSSWGPCSVTCRTGTQARERTCTNPTPVCGGNCTGYNRETKTCDTRQICPTHGNWGSWGPWQPCSHTCSIEGSARQPHQQRSRLCNNPPPSFSPPGKPCPGPREESQSCTGLPYCPRDGNWGGWKPMQPCTVTCGVGQILQKRLCDNPSPKYGGKNCLGEDVRRQPCTVKVPCPVDGHWDEWGPWTSCSRSGFEIECDEIPASQKRNRKCIGRRDAGKPCAGLRMETRVCYSFEGCPLPGTWSVWSPWGLCEPVCGPEPKRTRKRVCTAIYPNFSKVMPAENGKEHNITFSGNPKPQCKQLEGQELEVVEETRCQNVPLCED